MSMCHKSSIIDSTILIEVQMNYSVYMHVIITNDDDTYK